MRMRNGRCRLRGVTTAGLVALLLVSATAVNGQGLSVSDYERFQFYNACRPMGLRSHGGGSFNAGADAGTLQYEDGRPGTNLNPIVDVAKSRLRAERLYSLFESESNGAALVVSVDVRAVSRELVAYVEGKRHGRWVTRHKSGKQEVVTYKHGWQGKWAKTPDEDPKEVEVDENTPKGLDGDR